MEKKKIQQAASSSALPSNFPHPSALSALSHQTHSTTRRCTSRTDAVGRRLVLAGFAAAPWIALLNPHSCRADDDRSGILYPNGASNSLIRPFYEEGSWQPSIPLTTKLGKERIQTRQTSISPPSQIALPFITTEQELYFAPFLFGAWTVKATLQSKKYPFGTAVVPSNSLLEGSPRNRNEKVGDTTSYEMHYFSTMADLNTAAAASDNGNKLTTVNVVVVDPKSKPKIIADRAFNAISMSKAYRQLTPVQEVDWDYYKDPTKLTLRFATIPHSQMTCVQRRGEVYLTARTSENVGLDDDDDDETISAGTSIFGIAERSRTVTLSPGNVIVSDSETITEFRKLDNDHVTAVSRIVVFLTPNPNSREGIIWQQVGGKAVPFFDYELEMTRIKESSTTSTKDNNDGSSATLMEQRACLKTPNGIVQCVYTK